MNKDKLLELIEFLKTLSYEDFNFNEVVACYDDYTKCGTVCCAIGWLPKLFPDEVEWNITRRGIVGLFLKNEYGSICGSAKEYDDVAIHVFKLHPYVAQSLFAPDCQRMIHEDLRNLAKNARPTEVAEMLEHFIKLIETGKLKEDGSTI